MIGFIAFCIWRFYAFTIVLLLLVGICLLTLAIYNRRSGGGVMERNDAGLRQEHRLLLGGAGSFIFGIFLLGTGRHELVQIGAALIVIVIMVVIMAGVVGYPLGGKPKS
jgi:hypothetical protein